MEGWHVGVKSDRRMKKGEISGNTYAKSFFHHLLLRSTQEGWVADAAVWMAHGYPDFIRSLLPAGLLSESLNPK